MKNINDNFKTLTKKIKQQNAKITLIDSDTSLNFKEAKYGFEGQLFKTIMKQLVITTPILNSLKRKSLNFKYGLYINNQFEYLDLGKFYIKDDPEDDKGKEQTEITAYDNLVHFMKTFKQSEMNLTYPCTMGVFVQRMCEVCNVGLYSTDFFFNDLIINEDYFTTQEITYRDVLEKVAQATLTTIIIKDNKLYLAPISSNPVETLDRSYLSKLVITDKFGPVNALVLGRGDVEDNIEAKDDTSIAQNGRCELRFDENEFIQYQREEVINSMFEKIKGLTYYAFEASDIGVMWLDPADCIALKDNETDIYNSYYLDADITINTGIKSTTQSSIPDETETEYKVTTEEEKKYLKVERLAKKNEGLIQDLIQETSEYSEKFVEIEASLDGISQTVESFEDFTREKTQVDNLYIEDVAEGEGYILDFIVYGDTTLFNKKTITLCVSTKPKGYGEDVGLLTQSGEEILTEDNQSLVITRTSYHVITLELELDDVLRNLMVDDVVYYDELHVLQDGSITVTRRIGVNEQGELYLLPEEVVTTLEEKLILPTNKEQYYYFIDNIDYLRYYAKYITQNDYSDSFLTKMELGTKIEQNAEAVKVAWNQISEFIQMMIINNNASLAVLDEDNNILMSLDKEGQNFYKNGETIPFGELGVKKVGDNNYISFSLTGDYEETISDGMCWGITNKTTGKFYPILYIKDFSVGNENSEIGSGKLILEGCELVLDALASGINIGELNIHGDVLPGLFFTDANSGSNLLTILNEISNVRNASISMLDGNISFYKNQAGSYSFKVGQSSGSNGVLLTDGGSIQGDDVYANQLSVENWISCYGTITCDDLIETSVENKKENIRKYDNDALKEILATDIYYYNLKSNKKDLKIGTIIGDKYNCSKEFIRNNGVDIYSMTALAYKAIQQQQEEIDDLKTRLKNIEELLAKGE